MNWYRQNRSLGNFLVGTGVVTLMALWFLFHAKGNLEQASAQLRDTVTEQSRLEHLNPFPNEENFQKTRGELDNYTASLGKIKEELGAQVLPASPLAPNEFQSRLRQAIQTTTERAQTNRVRLPENFHLGFDEFTTTLPATSAAPRLGQELSQIELLLGILIDARVDAVTAVRRVNQSPEGNATATATPARKSSGVSATSPLHVELSTVDVAFTASPLALRKALNQIASSEHQFFIVRTLHVRNEQQKGPSREGTGPANVAPTNPSALKFIVGNEHVEVAAQIELVRFSF